MRGEISLIFLSWTEEMFNMVNGTYQPITHIGAAYGINTQGGEGDGD